MAIFIDKGMKAPDDPIFREGIGFVSIRKIELPDLKTSSDSPKKDPLLKKKTTSPRAF